MFPRHTQATRLSAACLAALALGFLSPATSAGISSSIVISQVYGGGGNSGATLIHSMSPGSCLSARASNTSASW